MKFVSAEGMREGEAKAIRERPRLGTAMMDRAGKGLALAICAIAKELDHPDPVVRLLAGPGNNGGDAFAAALFLDELDMWVEVWLACSAEKLKGAARGFFDQVVEAGIPCSRLSTERDWDTVDAEVFPPPILVDALLGTGAKGEPRGTVRRAVEYVRARRDKCMVVAADVPTGLDADSGVAAECSVRADYTVAMGYPKRGLAMPEALESAGSLWCVEIGMPAEHAVAIPDARPDLQWISDQDVRRIVPRRGRAAHKGVFGTALLAGGAAEYPGAIVLAAEGALRSGAGLVRVATTAGAAGALPARLPEAVVAANLWSGFSTAGADAVLAGPGLGRGEEAARLVERLLGEAGCPLVLDADALAPLAGEPERLRGCGVPVVLTPHPGELALLLGTDAATIQQDRLVAACEAAERTGAVVVLKGAGTLVAQAGRPTWINLNGNPGMACGGSGDVLAGLLAGLLAQGIGPFEAACAAVWLHGTAGDVAALRHTQAAMRAGDVAAALPAAFALAGVR